MQPIETQGGLGSMAGLYRHMSWLGAVAALALASAAEAQGAKDQSGKVVPASVKVSPPAARPAPVTAADVPLAMPANTVRCVYDNLTLEDREITMMLIGIDFLNEGRYAPIAPENRIVNRMVREALPRCAQAYRWSTAASDAAVAYAHSMLVQDVLRQAIEYEDLKVDPIDAYYRENRSRLAGKTRLDDMMEEGFATYLHKAGWKEDERGGRRLARVYLETMLSRDATERAFVKASAPGRPVTRPKRRARTT